MTNKELLEQAIADAGIKINKLMNVAGIRSYATFRGRMNNESEFTASEIQAISMALNLSASQRNRIFFATDV